MRNFKTTTNHKVVVDYMDWFYTWKDLREYFALDDLRGFIVFDGKQCDMQDIRDLPIDNEGLDYILWRRCSTEEHKQKILRDKRGFDYDERDEEYLNSRWGAYERDFEIRPFYISYYGSGAYRVQFCEAHEAQGIMLIDRKVENRQNSEDITRKVFEHYIEGEIYYVQVYSPHEAYFKEGDLQTQKGITFWDYEDGGIYYLTEEKAIESIPDYAGKIIEKTESLDLDVFELIPRTDN